eukprot:gb/GFBE01000813.1/.p1 GENE.gb/GFBE01000813.1/~~gb/GFBE01000813.1/.p1  ORF type:complete len:153 (+),score=18.25 gb/GFBE01000813.1/:1-459(+)
MAAADVCLPELPLRRKVSLNEQVTVIDISPLPSVRSSSSTGALPQLRKSQRAMRREAWADVPGSRSNSPASITMEGPEGEDRIVSRRPKKGPLRRLTTLPSELSARGRADAFMDFFRTSQALLTAPAEARPTNTSGAKLSPISSSLKHRLDT